VSNCTKCNIYQTIVRLKTSTVAPDQRCRYCHFHHPHQHQQQPTPPRLPICHQNFVNISMRLRCNCRHRLFRYRYPHSHDPMTTLSPSIATMAPNLSPATPSRAVNYERSTSTNTSWFRSARHNASANSCSNSATTPRPV